MVCTYGMQVDWKDQIHDYNKLIKKKKKRKHKGKRLLSQTQLHQCREQKSLHSQSLLKSKSLSLIAIEETHLQATV